jgi:hypothetical protein
MSDVKPNVFNNLSKEDLDKIKQDTIEKNKQLLESEKLMVSQKSETELKAEADMKRRTEEQLQKVLEAKAKKALDITNKAKAEGRSLTADDYDSSNNKPRYNGVNNIVFEDNNSNNNNKPPIQPPININQSNNDDNNNEKRKAEIEKLSTPDFNSPFDRLPLPSEGKIYKNYKKPYVDVSYITTFDESILTSPNLVESGDFIKILINRKLLSTDLRYEDLHSGDRNAIMIWLRATAYGTEYPIIVLDDDGTPFETEVDLSQLKTIKLGAEPDANGHFDYTLKQINVPIKFKFLTVGDSDEIDIQLEKDKESGSLLDNEKVYKLQKHIVGVMDENNNWITDTNQIKNFASNLRPLISNDLLKYIDSIESGMDLEIEVSTPRGGSIKTFLPLNKKFFWPNS